MEHTSSTSTAYTWVGETYGVHAVVGARVVHEGTDHGTVVEPEERDQYVHVLFDGETYPGRCHPLSLDYLDGVDPDARLTHHNARIDTWNDRLNGRITAEEYRQRMTAPLAPEAVSS